MVEQTECSHLVLFALLAYLVQIHVRLWLLKIKTVVKNSKALKSEIWGLALWLSG